MKAAQLQCRNPAQHYAEELEKAFPEVTFTSGLRDIAQQAHAMATNVVLNRKWVAQTYKATPERDAIQAWIDKHPQADTVGELAGGILNLFHAWTPERLSHVSLHMSGLAWDVKPLLSPRGDAIKAMIRAFPGVAFLEREGGLIRWHASWKDTTHA